MKNIWLSSIIPSKKLMDENILEKLVEMISALLK